MPDVNDFFEDFDGDLLEEIDERYKQISDRFTEHFGESIPLALIPSRVGLEELSDAVEKCIINNDGDILGMLKVEIHKNALY